MSRFIACLAALLGFALPAVAEEKKPNIIFILADDLGCFELGCYGQTKIQTLNIDKLAKDGIWFTHFYAGCPVCAPSRYTLMTGPMHNLRWSASGHRGLVESGAAKSGEGCREDGTLQPREGRIGEGRRFRE